MTENIYKKIMSARLQFLQSNPQKSGRNEFQKFNYYELDDIVPTATRICNNLGLYTEIDMGAETYGFATLTVVNVDNPEEKVYFRLKMPEINNENINNALQDTGRAETYLRRYLYLLFLDIAQNDEVDASDNRPKSGATKKPVKPRSRPSPSPTTKKQPATTNRRLTMKQKKEMKELDERIKNILSNHNQYVTMKNVLDDLQAMEDVGEITSEERLELEKKLSTI